MKNCTGKYILIIILFLFIFFPFQKVKAQQGDTLTVEWANPDGSVKINALYNTILTNEYLPDIIYRLKRGGYYWNTETIISNENLIIIGDKNVVEDSINHPASIQLVTRNDGSHSDIIFNAKNNLILKNVYIIGSDENGTQTNYRQIFAEADRSRFYFDNVIFDRSNYAPVIIKGRYNYLSISNCKFRNIDEVPDNSQWSGTSVSIAGDQDSVIIENNTFFNIGYTVLNATHGAINYIRFNHNTMVNIGREFVSGNNWWRTAFFANNLIINGFWHGENLADYSTFDRDPREIFKGLFTINRLPSRYGPEQGRKIRFKNTAAFLDTVFTNYYSDSIRSQPFVSTVTKEDILDIYEQMAARDTLWLAGKPNLNFYPEEIVDDMILNIKDIRTGKIPAHPYFYPVPVSGTDCYICPVWPLPENFSYTDNNLLTAGTDELPLGDLNWFPSQKRNWEVNKEQHILHLEEWDICNFCPPYMLYLEAENGILLNDAVIKKFEGFCYFNLVSGFFEWTFNLPSAGQYDLSVWTHMRGNTRNGNNTYVNEKEIHDRAHNWGQFVYDSDYGVTAGMPVDKWTWIRWKQEDIAEPGAFTFPAGRNKIQFAASWGEQNFAGIDLFSAGSDKPAIQLRIPDVTDFSMVYPISDGKSWLPNMLKFVDMGLNGVINWDADFPLDGNYDIQIFYQNPGIDQTGELFIDNSLSASILFPASRDSSGGNVFINQVPVVKGRHVVSLKGSKINIDLIIIYNFPISSFNDSQGVTTYSLNQNYPNPFNPITTISFSVPSISEVSLKIYDILGREITTLVSGELSAGTHSAKWNAGNIASGVYFYRLQAGSFTETKKLVLVR